MYESSVVRLAQAGKNRPAVSALIRYGTRSGRIHDFRNWPAQIRERGLSSPRHEPLAEKEKRAFDGEEKNRGGGVNEQLDREQG